MDKDNDKDRGDKLGAAGADPASFLDAATLFGESEGLVWSLN